MISVLEKRKLFHRALNEELRVAAATALGEIGDESARPALEKAVNDSSADVARAAAQALMQLEKDNP